MTFEKKCLIEPGDFISVQYECDKCHAAIVVPIEKLNPEQSASVVLRGCSYCQTPSGFQPQSQEVQAYLDFLSSLNRIGNAMKGRNLRIRLAVKCPE